LFMVRNKPFDLKVKGLESIMNLQTQYYI